MDSNLQVLNSERAVHLLQKRLDATEPGYIAQKDKANFKFARTVLKLAKKQGAVLPDIGSIPGVCKFCRGRRGHITAASAKLMPISYDVCEDCFIEEYETALRRDTKSDCYQIVIAPQNCIDQEMAPTNLANTITIEFINTSAVLCAHKREYSIAYSELDTVPLVDGYPDRDRLYHNMLVVPPDVFTLLGIKSKPTVVRAIHVPICVTTFVSGIRCAPYFSYTPTGARYLETGESGKSTAPVGGMVKQIMDTTTNPLSPVLHTRCGGCMGITPLSPNTPRDYQLHVDHPMYIIYNRVLQLKKKLTALKREIPALVVDTNKYISERELQELLPESSDYF